VTGRRTPRRVCAEAGLDERAGVRVWKPYEHLEAGIQQALRRAAGTALRLVADGDITPHGRLAAALRPPDDRDVYAGDPADPAEQERRAQHEKLSRLWTEAEAELQAWFEAARTDPVAARQIWGLYTSGGQFISPSRAH
jgi:hypothetical protein